MSAPTHRCTTCGEEKPLSAFYRWRSNRANEAWYCDDCNRVKSTEGVRRYRQDPAKRERDRERSRAWKERNRERTRAYDRERARQKRAAA